MPALIDDLLYERRFYDTLRGRCATHFAFCGQLRGGQLYYHHYSWVFIYCAEHDVIAVEGWGNRSEMAVLVDKTLRLLDETRIQPQIVHRDNSGEPSFLLDVKYAARFNPQTGELFVATAVPGDWMMAGLHYEQAGYPWKCRHVRPDPWSTTAQRLIGILELTWQKGRWMVLRR